MITGSLPALVTPFANGKVDIDALKKLVDWHIDQGSHGLVPVGTTGESPTLTHEEHDRVVEVVVAQAAARFRRYCWSLHQQSCLLYTSPSPRDVEESRMPSSA